MKKDKKGLEYYDFEFGLGDPTLCELVEDGKHILVVQRIFKRKSAEKIIVDNHYHDYYEMEIVLSGSVNNIIGNQNFIMKPYDYTLLSPNDIHKLEYVDDNLVNITIKFDTAGFRTKTKRMLESLQYPVAGSLTENVALYIGSSIERIALAKDKINDDEAYSQLLSDMLEGMLIYMIKSAKKENVEYGSYSNDNEEIFKIVNYIKVNFRNTVKLSEMAEMVGYNESYLSEKFKNVVGVSFKRFLMSTRLKNAYNMVIMTDRPIGEISAESGFSDFANFSKYFKNEYGCSPRVLREKQKNTIKN